MIKVTVVPEKLKRLFGGFVIPNTQYACTFVDADTNKLLSERTVSGASLEEDDENGLLIVNGFIKEFMRTNFPNEEYNIEIKSS